MSQSPCRIPYYAFKPVYEFVKPISHIHDCEHDWTRFFSRVQGVWKAYERRVHFRGQSCSGVFGRMKDVLPEKSCWIFEHVQKSNTIFNGFYGPLTGVWKACSTVWKGVFGRVQAYEGRVHFLAIRLNTSFIRLNTTFIRLSYASHTPEHVFHTPAKSRQISSRDTLSSAIFTFTYNNMKKLRGRRTRGVSTRKPLTGPRNPVTTFVWRHWLWKQYFKNTPIYSIPLNELLNEI